MDNLNPSPLTQFYTFLKALFISTLFISTLTEISFASDRKIGVAGDPYPPWVIGEIDTQTTKGIAVELTKELFRRLDKEIVINIYPFKRGLDRIKHGDEDVILMVSISEERKEFMVFTDSISFVEIVFFHTKKLKDFDWNSRSDLKPYNIGVISGVNMGNEWRDAISTYNLKVEETSSDKLNIEKLLKGRVDLIAADKKVMQEIIRQNLDYRGKIQWHEKVIFASKKSLGISKKSPLVLLLPQINSTLQEIKDDGTYQNIICKYPNSFSRSCDNN